MKDLEEVITAYGFRTEVSCGALISVYGRKSKFQLFHALQTLIESGKIVEFTLDDERWYRKVGMPIGKEQTTHDISELRFIL
jgi:hypothetical protein